MIFILFNTVEVLHSVARVLLNVSVMVESFELVVAAGVVAVIAGSTTSFVKIERP